jgi:flagellin
MIINHNISALNTHRQLGANNNAVQNSLEKLSSGLRINKAGDDAAGLAISEKMRGQIRGLDMAAKNAQDATSLIQTAEGGLNEAHDILQRMRELAVQASNDTNTTSDRAEIQKEINQLTEEIDRIGNNTEFNTKKLLNGSVGVSGYTDAPAELSKISVGSETTSGTYAISGVTLADKSAATSSPESLGVDTVGLTANSALSAFGATAQSGNITVNGKSFSFTDSTDTVQDLVDTINAASSETGVIASATVTAGDGSGTDATIEWSFEAVNAGSSSQVAVSGATGVFSGTYGVTQGTDATFTIAGTDESGVAITLNASDFEVEGNKVSYTKGNAEGLSFTVDNTTGGNVIVNDNNTLSFQIGANENQAMDVAIQDMRASALNVDSIDVSSAASAGNAIATIDNAIQQVSAERSKLGSYQNRLEHTINNLNTSSENLTAAESRIRDVDMAKEMMEFTKNNILSQAAQSMLAQANQQPQGVLQLLQ